MEAVVPGQWLLVNESERDFKAVGYMQCTPLNLFVLVCVKLICVPLQNLVLCDFIFFYTTIPIITPSNTNFPSTTP